MMDKESVQNCNVRCWFRAENKDCNDNFFLFLFFGKKKVSRFFSGVRLAKNFFKNFRLNFRLLKSRVIFDVYNIYNFNFFDSF